MRGARCEAYARLYGDRIIPADAGSTAKGYIAVEKAEDHPRGCGEHEGNCVSG